MDTGAIQYPGSGSCKIPPLDSHLKGFLITSPQLESIKSKRESKRERERDYGSFCQLLKRGGSASMACDGWLLSRRDSESGRQLIAGWPRAFHLYRRSCQLFSLCSLPGNFSSFLFDKHSLSLSLYEMRRDHSKRKPGLSRAGGRPRLPANGRGVHNSARPLLNERPFVSQPIGLTSQFY